MLPRKGYFTITVSEETYKLIQKIIIDENYKAGYMKYRSIKDFIEKLIEQYAKEKGLIK